MRIEVAGQDGGAPIPEAPGCGGFRIAFDGDEPDVRFLPGGRQLGSGVVAAVLRGLAEAPALLLATLGLAPGRRPYDRVEVSLDAGELIEGEARPLGQGVIRLSLGEDASAEDSARIARHEALHLLLAASLSGGSRWSDPELAFADWIVRGIESGLDAQLPRFHAPLPRLLEPLPSSRGEVQKQLANVSASPGAARGYFGEKLFGELQRIAAAAKDRALAEQKQLWLVEASLGTHFIEAASVLAFEDAGALRPVVLDDWLLEYERHARALANAPSGAGNLWRLSAPGWSRDPLTRLSAAAQALQREDHQFFAGERFTHGAEPVVWKNGGRVRLPLLPAPARARPAPIHGFRAVLRELGTAEAEQALALVEQAARGEAQFFEARALWPRILARLIAAGLPTSADPRGAPVATVHIVDDGAAYEEWSSAAARLRALCGEVAPWVPRVAEPQRVATLAEAPRAAASMLLVYSAPLGVAELAEARKLAARLPVRGALFHAHLDRGNAFERLPDLEAPLDPRYREEVWVSGSPPERLANLPAAADCAGTPVAHLLSLMAIGVEECHYAMRAAGVRPGNPGMS